MSVSDTVDNSKTEFANASISWQAKVFNKVFLSTFVKSHMHQMETDMYMDVGKFRRFAKKFDSIMSSQPHGVCVSSKKIAGVHCSWLTVPSQSKRVILYLHGGGFCIHMPKTYDGFVSKLASQLNANALIPDYRLAPESPFPSGSDDCLACYKWLLNQGYSPHNIIIAGDSAGGQFTLTTLIRIRDEQLPIPAAAILISPCTDLSQEGFDIMGEDDGRDPMFVKGAMLQMGKNYIPSSHDDHDPLISPVYDHLSGLPPIQCHVGSTELLFTHSTRLIENIKRNNRPAELLIWKDMPHVHPLFSILPESKLALDKMIDFANKELAKAD